MNLRSSLFAGLVFSGLAGCGPEARDGIPTITYRSDCLTFQAEQEISQERLDHNVALAREVLAPIVGGGFCEAFAGLRIRIRSEVSWPCWGHEACFGESWGTGDIHLGRSGGQLAHELLHAWDDQHLQPNPGHVAWDSNGYNRALQAWDSGPSEGQGWWRLNPQDYEATR